MDQELSGAGKCICDPWQNPRRVQFCRVASEGQEEDSLLFTFLVLLQHDYYPRICSKEIRKSLDKEQHLYQTEWWNLPVDKSDYTWTQTSLPSLLVSFSESFVLELAAHLYSRHALPGSDGIRNLPMWNNNNNQMKEVIENITGHNFNKCWLLSLCSLVFIVLYTANRSKCFVFLTNISCNHKLAHFSAKSDISS